LTHEGYSRVLESFQKENGVQFNFNNEPSIRSENGLADSMAVSQNSQSSGSLSTRSNKKSSSPQSNQNSTTTSSSAAVKAAAATFAEDIVATAMVNATSRPSVVRSVVQQFIHEQMDERRIIVRLVRKGNCSAAIEKLEQIYPNLLEGNRQLSLLLKIQQFVELIDKTAKVGHSIGWKINF
jgi:hypothetical protein